MLQQSLLQQKARERGFFNLSTVPHKDLLALYKDTLKELDIYLDTGDLRKLTPNAVGYIKQDILDMIGGMREIPLSEQKERIISRDGILNNLRLARDNLQTTHGLFKGDFLDESKSKKFFSELRLARDNIEKTLKLFK